MKKFFGLIAMLIVGGLVLAGCSNSTPPTPQQSPSPVSHAWPPTPKAPVEIAKNLLARNDLIVLDNSGSMKDSECSGNQSKFNVARAALKVFGASLPSEDNLALAVFSGGSAQVVVPFGVGQANRTEFSAKLDKLSSDQSTPLYGATKFAYAEMTKQAERQLGYGTYRLIIITDGYSGDGDPAPLVKSIVGESPVEIYVIGFCVGSSHSLNIPGVTTYYTAGNPKELSEGLAKVQQAETTHFDVTAFSK